MERQPFVLRRTMPGFQLTWLKIADGGLGEDEAKCAEGAFLAQEKFMSLFHAVVWIDHHSALIQQFDGDDVQAEKVKDHRHYTRQHGSGVRTEHEFFGEVCDALDGVAEVLVTGSHTAQADFRHYVDKHRPALKPKIVGWETVDHPSDGQLVALARKFFEKYARMRGGSAGG